VADEREVMERLFSCFDTMYAVLGAGAVDLSDDAYVVRTYETGRAMGEVALSFREYLVDVETSMVPSIQGVLVDSLANDLTGAMVLFCFTMVVAPRLLVSLRDAREQVELGDGALDVLNIASQVLIREMFATGEVAKTEGVSEDRHWQEHARGLSESLDQVGNAESFGISR
jgi:hypothetical protein